MFKEILFLELVAILISRAEIFELFCYRVFWVTPMLNYFEFGPSVYKFFLVLAPVAILWNHLSNFGRGHYGENLTL